jgi:DNA-binding MarR family transcriptional regulator
VAKTPPRGGARDDETAVAEALRRIVRTLRLSTAEVGRVAGITGAQLLVLRVLSERPGASLSDVAEATLTDPSSVSVVVRRLVEAGLVRRGADPGDARRMRLDVTPAGAALLRAAPSPAQERLLAALGTLPRPELRRLARSLEALVRAMGAEGAPAAMFFEDEGGRRRAEGNRP